MFCSEKSKKLLLDKIIKSIPFFACLSGEQMEELRNVLIEKHFPRNKIIFVEREIISVLCARLREAWMVNKVLSLPGAEERVKEILKIMAMHSGVKDNDGEIEILDDKNILLKPSFQ